MHADTLDAPATIETLRKLADKIERRPLDRQTINEVSLAGTKGWKVAEYMPAWDNRKKLPKTKLFEVIGWHIYSVLDGFIKVAPITQNGVVYIDGYEFTALVDPDGRHTSYEDDATCGFETRAEWIANERQKVDDGKVPWARLT